MKPQKVILIIFISFLLALLFYIPNNIEARSGCCSWHGGVCGCRCCDGTSLSSKCAPYYPSCNPTQKTITPQIPQTTKQPPKTRDNCVEKLMGAAFCKDGNIFQKQMLKDCSIIDYLIKNCSGNQICKDGKCEEVEYCGDGICQKNENCSICPKDCGICKQISKNEPYTETNWSDNDVQAIPTGAIIEKGRNNNSPISAVYSFIKDLFSWFGF